MHELQVKYHHLFELNSRDHVIPASGYLIEEVTRVLGLPNMCAVVPHILHRVAGFTLDVEVPQSKLGRLEEKIKAIEKHFAEQGWLKEVVKLSPT